MEDLSFIVNWGKDKVNAWSGTNYSIYSALQNYFNVKEYQTSEEYCKESNSFFSRVLYKIFRIRREYSFDKDFDVRRIKYNRNYFRKVSGLVFQFDEILRDTKARNTFIYQDFSVDYLDYLRKDDSETLGRSGFRFIANEAVEKRKKLQNEYFQGCSAIFCMGKWLASYMCAAHPEWKHKIYHVGGGVNLDQSKISPNPNKTHNKILYVGRDYKLKGGVDTIEAFKKLKEKRPDLELHFCGPKRNPVEGEL